MLEITSKNDGFQILDLCEPKNERDGLLPLDINAFDTLTEQAAYWIGFLLADGSVYNNQLSLTLQKSDRLHVESFKHFVGSGSDVKIIRNAARLNIYSKTLIKKLSAFGVVPNKSLIATPPQELISNIHFWRGMIDGDGTISHTQSYPRIGLCGSQACCNGFAALVKSITNTRSNTYPYKSIWMFQVSGKHAERVIETLYKNCTIALTRKLDLAKKWVQI